MAMVNATAVRVGFTSQVPSFCLRAINATDAPDISLQIAAVSGFEGFCIDILLMLTQPLGIGLTIVHEASSYDELHEALMQSRIEIIGELLEPMLEVLTSGELALNDETDQLTLLQERRVVIAAEHDADPTAEWFTFWYIYSGRVWLAWLSAMLCVGSVLYLCNSNYSSRRALSNVSVVERFEAGVWRRKEAAENEEESRSASSYLFATLALGCGQGHYCQALQQPESAKMLCMGAIFFGLIYWTYAISSLVRVYSSDDLSLPYRDVREMMEQGRMFAVVNVGFGVECDFDKLWT